MRPRRSNLSLNTTAEADSSPPNVDAEVRAAGRSTEIARAQESTLMTQSTTRPVAPAVVLPRPLGRSLQANLSTAELYEAAIRDR